jgi:hypothetical protein
MSNKHTHSDLLAKAMARVRAKHNLPNAEAEEVELQCPLCGGTAPENEFSEVEEPDTEDESEGDDGGDAEDTYKTDPISTSTTNNDDSNSRDVDQVPKWDNRRRIDALARDLAAAASTNKPPQK